MRDSAVAPYARETPPYRHELRCVAVCGHHKLMQRCDGRYYDIDSRGVLSKVGRFKSPREAKAVWQGRIRAGKVDI